MSVHEINVWAKVLGIRLYWKRQHAQWRNWQRAEIAQVSVSGKRIGFKTEVDIERYLKDVAEGSVA